MYLNTTCFRRNMGSSSALLQKYGKLKPIVARKYVPLISDLFMSSYADTTHYRKLFFVYYYTRCGYLDDKYYYGDEAALFGDVIIAQEDKNPGFVDRVFAGIYTLGDEVLARSEELRMKRYSGIPLAALLNTFKNFTTIYTTFAISLMGFNIQFPVESRLKQVVQNRENPSDDMGILSYPSKENSAAMEQIGLLKIGILVRKAGAARLDTLSAALLRKIQRHIHEYGWINTRGGVGDPWTKQEIFERILELEGDLGKMLAESRQHKRKAKQETELLLNQLHADARTVQLVHLAKELVYFRTYRTDYLNKAFFNIRPLLEAIALLRKMSYHDILYLRIQEIEENISVPRQEIERRKGNYALMTLEPHKLIFTSDRNEIRRIKERYCEDFTVDSPEITGKTGYGGNVKGKVKLVFTKSDLPKVARGDILVTPMTTPNFIQAMERAAAFVTDEGGITCHAAIVAREMKKPCIIGTRTATQSLRDNDVVEIDADKGIIRILKRTQGK